MPFNNSELTNCLEQWKELGKLSRLFLAKKITTDSIDYLLSIPDWFELRDKELMVQVNRVKAVWKDTLIDIKLEHDVFLKDTFFKFILSNSDFIKSKWELKQIWDLIYEKKSFWIVFWYSLYDENGEVVSIYNESVVNLEEQMSQILFYFLNSRYNYKINYIVPFIIS